MSEDKYAIIRDYIHELDSQSYISLSHVTLRQLYSVHGKAKVCELIDSYFEDAGEIECRRKLGHTNNGPQELQASKE